MKLVSFFNKGKLLAQYYVHRLEELRTLFAIHRNSQSEVYDLDKCQFISREEVAEAVKEKEPETKKETDEKIVRPKSKNWSCKVKCIETGEVFGSINECSQKLHLSYKAIWNCLRSGSARGGLHFIQLESNE